MLEKSGHAAVTAKDGQEALAVHSIFKGKKYARAYGTVIPLIGQECEHKPQLDQSSQNYQGKWTVISTWPNIRLYRRGMAGSHGARN
jgi:hypothetical protein